MYTDKDYVLMQCLLHGLDSHKVYSGQYCRIVSTIIILIYVTGHNQGLSSITFSHLINLNVQLHVRKNIVELRMFHSF